MSVNSTIASTVSLYGSLDNSTLSETENNESSVDYTFCRDFMVVVDLCFGVLVYIPGILGNIVSFVVFGKDGSNPAASLQLRALDAADTTLLVGVINTYVIKYLYGHIQSLPGLVFRKVNDILWFTAQTTTIWLQVVIAINRFVGVCLPLKARYLCSRARIRFQIACVVILSLLVIIPYWFVWKIVKHGDGTSGSYTYKNVEWGNRDIYKRIYNIIYQVCMLALPLLLLVVFNICIIVAHKRATRRRQQMQNMNRADRNNARNEDSITRLMITVVLAFLISFTPQVISNLIDPSYKFCSLRYYIVYMFACIQLSNSAVNFVIYVCILKSFRRTLKSCCLCHVNRSSL